MKELYPGIFLVTERGGWGPMRPPVNIYILTGNDGLVFDAGYGTKGSVRYLVREIRRIEEHCRGRGESCSISSVLPSHAHPDHFAGLAALRAEMGLRILLTGPMLETIGTRKAYRASYRIERNDEGPLVRFARDHFLRPAESWFYESLYGTRFISDPDGIIRNGTVMEIGGRAWRVIASPGHSPDHLSLYDEASGILLGGDNVLRSVTTWLGPPKSDLKKYILTLEMIASLPGLRRILGAHGRPVEDPRERIAKIIQWRRRRLEQVYEAVTNGGAGITKKEVIRAIYGDEGLLKRYMVDGWIDLSLRCLVDDGRIREVSPGRYAAPVSAG